MGRLRSIDSPKKALDLSWVPDGMDHSAACRLAIRVPGYEQLVENDRTEYHITNDEKVFHANLFPDNENISDYIPDTDEEDNDNCAVDDDEDCVAVEHVTDLENPKIEVGVTFEDGHTFKKAIRQYAILNEIEIAAPYSEAKRYRGFCKAKKCKWRIHASQLQDGRTWMIKKRPNKHYCKSTSKLESNCMANQFWGLELEDYVDSSYSVSKFNAAYEGWIEPIPDKTQWPKVDMGFKLWPLVLKRAAGRPRTRRMKGVEEGGCYGNSEPPEGGRVTDLSAIYLSIPPRNSSHNRGSKKRRQYKRCGQFGHIQKTCNETVYDSDAPPPVPPKPKRKRAKKKEEVVTEEVEANPSTPKRKRTKRMKEVIIEEVAASPSTPLRLQQGPSSPFDLSCKHRLQQTPSNPFDLNCSPRALTRSRARKIAMEEAEVHGRMVLKHLMHYYFESCKGILVFALHDLCWQADI
ncbi:hypothetical protein U9M48_031833 [Paspalum notatum var. saurae]|uniref:Transposase MuDR plant domain-containing protein n=1 Tax=Paspalum notatum var. saurae TaxID=547442 RepID=A0AAQ3X4S0_PASNO